MRLVHRSLRDPNRAFAYSFLYLKGFFHKVTGAGYKARIAPSFHDRTYLSWKLFQMLGISITTDEHADICYYHEDTTEASEPGKFDDFINGRCIDISKSRVHKAFHEAFGYSIDVDPTKYDGLLVSKSNVNSKHDGYIIQGPIKERESGRVYERL